jgi:hypothetical protein
MTVWWSAEGAKLRSMRRSLVALALLCLAARASDPALPFPADYREWVFLSSGLGMTYGPAAASSGDSPRFDNVFVSPAAYRSFLTSGQWPDKTMFVLEIRSSESKGSINNGGHYQSGGIVALEAEVKDHGQWTFYSFGTGAAEGKPFPRTQNCYACHATNGAVDNTFVQFYPTLLPVARSHGTLKGQ